jgi:hypothetical protein
MLKQFGYACHVIRARLAVWVTVSRRDALYGVWVCFFSFHLCFIGVHHHSTITVLLKSPYHASKVGVFLMKEHGSGLKKTASCPRDSKRKLHHSRSCYANVVKSFVCSC